MLMVDPVEVRYGKHKIKIPDPIRFCFNKLLVSQRRKKKDKREKDLGTAVEIAALLSRFPKWRKLLPVRLEELPRKQRALVLSLLKQNGSPAVAAVGVVGVGHAGAMRMGNNARPSLPTGQEAAVIVKGRTGPVCPRQYPNAGSEGQDKTCKQIPLTF